MLLFCRFVTPSNNNLSFEFFYLVYSKNLNLYFLKYSILRYLIDLYDDLSIH